MSHRALGEQFAESDSPHGPGWYQRPLPGMEHLSKDDKVPVQHLFKHAQMDPHPGEYGITTNTRPRTTTVRTDSLRPTQDYVTEAYIHGEPTGKAAKEGPGVIRDSKGRNLIVDGHHRVARALLRGEKKIRVQQFDVRGFGR